MKQTSNKVVLIVLIASVLGGFGLFQSAQSDKDQIKQIKVNIENDKQETNQMKNKQTDKIKEMPSQYKAMEIAAGNLITKEEYLLGLTWKSGVYQSNIVKSEKYSNVQASIINSFTENVERSLIIKPFNNNPNWKTKLLKPAQTTVGSIPVMIAYYNEKNDFVKGVELEYDVTRNRFSEVSFVYTEKGNVTENEQFFNTPQASKKQDDPKVGEQ